MKVRDLIKIIYDRQEVKICDSISFSFCELDEDGEWDCEECMYCEFEGNECKHLLERNEKRVLFSGYCDEVPIKLAEFRVMEIRVKEEGNGRRRKQIIEILIAD